MIKNVTAAVYTKGEEKLNYLTHAAGAVFGIVALVLCAVRAHQNGGAVDVFVAVLYGLSITVMFTASAVYHAMPESNIKLVCRVIDHCMIFLAIAGTATPCAYNIIHSNPFSAALILTVSWLALAVGVSATVINFEKSKKIQLAMYVTVGIAAGVFGIPALVNYSDKSVIIYLCGGGAAYLIGFVFYVLHKKKGYTYFHGIFHIFVLAGAVIHFLGIYKFVF